MSNFARTAFPAAVGVAKPPRAGEARHPWELMARGSLTTFRGWNLVTKSVSPSPRATAPPTLPDDLRDRPGLRLALAALLKKEPLTATEFQRAVNLSVHWASELRAEMEEWGLVRSEEAFEGRVRYRLIYLTPEGRDVAQARATYDGLLTRVKEKKERKEKR